MVKRLSHYGEVFRDTSPGKEATLVIRGIFHQNKGDSYHARVLKGEGKEADEKKRGNVLWKGDYFVSEWGSPIEARAEAERGAVAYVMSEKGMKKLGLTSATMPNPCFPCMANPASTTRRGRIQMLVGGLLGAVGIGSFVAGHRISQSQP